jgi:hypothetical protein
MTEGKNTWHISEIGVWDESVQAKLSPIELPEGCVVHVSLDAGTPACIAFERSLRLPCSCRCHKAAARSCSECVPCYG